MKTKPETEFVLVRPKRDKATRASFSIIRNNEKLDLTDLVYLKVIDGPNHIEEWVHKDDYQFYFNELHKHDDLKEWNGSEDQKEFTKELNKKAYYTFKSRAEFMCANTSTWKDPQ